MQLDLRFGGVRICIAGSAGVPPALSLSLNCGRTPVDNVGPQPALPGKSRHYPCAEWFDRLHWADYHKSCANKPGDRCLALASRSNRGKQGWGRGKSELRRAVCSLTARVGGGCRHGDRTPLIRKVPQKIYRPSIDG